MCTRCFEKNFSARKQIDIILCQNFDNINKSADVLVGNCDHLPQGKTFKNLLSISKVESRVQRSLLLLLLDQFMIRCTKNFSLLANNRKPERLPKNSSGLLRKKNRLLFFSSERLLKQTFPCNTQLQTNIFVHPWLPTIGQERFFDLRVMSPLFFLNCFKIFPVDVMLVEGRMLCHC